MFYRIINFEIVHSVNAAGSNENEVYYNSNCCRNMDISGQYIRRRRHHVCGMVRRDLIRRMKVCKCLTFCDKGYSVTNFRGKKVWM